MMLELNKVTYEFTAFGDKYLARWDKKGEEQFDVFVSKNYEHLGVATNVAGLPSQETSVLAIEGAIQHLTK